MDTSSADGLLPESPCLYIVCMILWMSSRILNPSFVLNPTFRLHTSLNPSVCQFHGTYSTQSKLYLAVITLFSKRTVIVVFSPRRAWSWSWNVGFKSPLPEFSSPPSREDAPRSDDDADVG